jgi:hypothetical protein
MNAKRRSSLFACLLPVVAIAASGCAQSESVSGEDVNLDGNDLGVRQGVDYSWGRPSPAGLIADGYTFAARYLSYDTSGKSLTHGEADALIAAGVDIVCVWEQGADDALDGYGQGVADAQAAAAQAASVGMPSDRPIYFAVDFDAQASQQGTVDAYFDGVASVIGRGRTGAYGGYYLISRLFDDGRITWGWQAYAWSYGNWDGRAQVRQVDNGQTVAGGSVDLDTAMVADFGQWGHGGAGAPSPSAAVEVAFQANTSDLWTTGTAGTVDWKLGMMTSTSPAIAADASGGYEVAFQANTGNLWVVDSAGHGGDQQLGMMAGTSPAITALAGGGYQVAFQANTGNLWTTGSAGTRDLGLGMMGGTSPAITALTGGGYEIAFQANTTDLWTTGDAGTSDWKLGMMVGSSPAIAGLADGSFEVAFEANTTSLWVVNSNGGGGDQGLGMYSGTSPSITAYGYGWQVAFEANTTSLWTTGIGGTKDWQLGMMAGTSPSIAAIPGGFQVSFEANTTSLWTVSSAGGGGDQHLGMMNGTSPSGS